MTDFSSKLDVITVVFNPRRYQSRYRLYKNFEQDCMDANARLWTVEIAFGERPFEVTTAKNPYNIQLRTSTELWYKENAINIALSRLPTDASYIAWIDADCKFARHDWASETVHQLQHYDVVQMYSHLIDLGPDHTTLKTLESFASKYMSTDWNPKASAYNGKLGFKRIWTPGLAWAAKRQTLDKLGGLFDYSILGSGDYHFSLALVNQINPITHDPYFKLPGYYDALLRYQELAQIHVKRNIGHVPGTALHYWHGRKVQRFYGSRWQILINNKFCPYQHLNKDIQGLYTLSHKAPHTLRDDIRNYFSSRNEDSIDLL